MVQTQLAHHDHRSYYAVIMLTCIWTGKSDKKHYAMFRSFYKIPAPVFALASNGSFIQASVYVQDLSVKRSWETLIPLAWKLIRENNWMACRFSDIWVRAARYACLQILREQDKIDFHWIWIVTLGCFIKYHSFRKWSMACFVFYLLRSSPSNCMIHSFKYTFYKNTTSYNKQQSYRICYICIYSFSKWFYPKWLANKE